ncbi:MAG TPA: LpqN/LpqT family lipoprotein [Mycobacterium sp.]|nr:LpqN/LpqT family lipoprotein [Mycobacterium sp.]
MIEMARRWRVLAAGVAAGMAGVLGFAGTTASAEPVYPQPPLPAPATVTQTVTVAPNAASQVAGQQGVTPATLASPGTAATPGLVAAPVAAPPVTITPASSGTLFDYFKEKGVQLEPQSSRDFKALTIVLPMPKRWAHVPDPNVPDAFAVIADRTSPDLYTPNAQVIVYKLIGDFDPKEAISHGLIDTQQLPAFRAIAASLADFGGMPSSFIEGTYRENSLTLNTSRRHVIATTGPDRYLVSLSVTSSAGNQGVSSAVEATDAVLKGFRVRVPTAAAPVAPAAPPAQPSPAATPPQLLGLPG